jgi:ATP-dependent Zn protease
MSTEIGPVALETMDSGYLRGASAMERDYSEHVSAKIDQEVSKIMNEALAKARELLSTHRKVLDAIAEELIAKETLEQKEYETLVKLHGIKLAHREEEKVVQVSHVEESISEVSSEAPAIPQATTVTHETVQSEHFDPRKGKKGKK